MVEMLFVENIYCDDYSYSLHVSKSDDEDRVETMCVVESHNRITRPYSEVQYTMLLRQR